MHKMYWLAAVQGCIRYINTEKYSCNSADKQYVNGYLLNDDALLSLFSTKKTNPASPLMCAHCVLDK